MTWTYDPTLDTDLDKVRFLIGDTDTTSQQLSNEEITFLLADRENNVDQTAIYALDGIIAKYSRKVNVTVGDVQVQYASMMSQFESVRKRLMARSAKTGIYVGGMVDSNGEEVKPFFTRTFP